VAAFSVVLYVYSPRLKGNGALGNVTIFICVGGLVIWAAMGSDALDSVEAWTFALLLAVLNFIREWVKDVQDKEGDRAARHNTMAMRLTPDQNRIGVLFGLALTGIMVVLWSAKVAIALPAILTWVAIYLATMLKAFNANYKSLSAWIKVLLGALFLLILES